MKVIIIALIILLIITLIIKNNKEGFYTLITQLDYSAWLYSQLFFLINHYIYCKNNEINFIIDTDDWLFKYKDGWIDYFEPIILSYSSIIESKTVKHNIDRLLYFFSLEEVLRKCGEKPPFSKGNAPVQKSTTNYQTTN